MSVLARMTLGTGNTRSPRIERGEPGQRPVRYELGQFAVYGPGACGFDGLGNALLEVQRAERQQRVEQMDRDVWFELLKVALRCHSSVAVASASNRRRAISRYAG